MTGWLVAGAVLWVAVSLPLGRALGRNARAVAALDALADWYRTLR